LTGGHKVFSHFLLQEEELDLIFIALNSFLFMVSEFFFPHLPVNICLWFAEVHIPFEAPSSYDR
jgi:hypothetical protein